MSTPPPAHTRPFFAPLELRHILFKTAIDSFHKKLNEIETPEYKLQVKDIKVDDHSHITPSLQKTAVLEKKDLTVALKGTFELIHKPTGKVVETKHTTIAHLPFITSHNTAIYNGAEYESMNQQRLLPGIYHRIRQDGLAEAFINPEPRTGQSGRILFLPDKQVFILMIKNSQVKLYGLLHDFGVSDDQIKHAWGEQIFKANKALYTGDEIDKLYALVIRERD